MKLIENTGELPTEIETFVKSWKKTDKHPCPKCGIKLGMPNYQCNKCNIKLKLKMRIDL